MRSVISCLQTPAPTPRAIVWDLLRETREGRLEWDAVASKGYFSAGNGNRVFSLRHRGTDPCGEGPNRFRHTLRVKDGLGNSLLLVGAGPEDPSLEELYELVSQTTQPLWSADEVREVAALAGSAP